MLPAKCMQITSSLVLYFGASEICFETSLWFAGLPTVKPGTAHSEKPQTVKVETARKAGSCGKDMVPTAIGERWCVMRGLSWYFHGSQQFPSQNSSQFCASKKKQHGTSRELEHGP